MKEKIKFIIFILIILFVLLWAGWSYYGNLNEEEWERIENSPERGSAIYRY